MINKWKLLKDLPDVKAGAIFSKYSKHSVSCSYINDKGFEDYFDVDKVENNPDWFTSYLFTSFDNIDVFKGDTIYCTFNDNPLLIEKHTDYTFNCVPFGKGFSTKEKAQEYLESLTPKFNIGDIIYSNYKPYNVGIKTILEIRGDTRIWVSNGINEKPSIESLLDIENVRKATNEEIIQYYKQQGWVKGAKFIETCNQKEHYIDKLEFNETSGNLCVKSNGYLYTLEHCELIKTPEYPKSFEDLLGKRMKGSYFNGDNLITDEWLIDEFDKNLFATEKQANSSRAFAQLTMLHSKFIEVYNKENNCNWKPQWNNNEDKWVIILITNCSKPYLHVRACTNTFYHLAFPDEFLAILFLDYHRQLLEQYYEL